MATMLASSGEQRPQAYSLTDLNTRFEQHVAVILFRTNSMANYLKGLSAMSWIAIIALAILMATAPLTLPANYQFMLTVTIYIVILRQIWFFIKSTGEVAKLLWILFTLLIAHNPLIASYLKNTRVWIMIVVYTGLMLLYLELRLVLEQQKLFSSNGGRTDSAE